MPIPQAIMMDYRESKSITTGLNEFNNYSVTIDYATCGFPPSQQIHVRPNQQMERVLRQIVHPQALLEGNLIEDLTNSLAFWNMGKRAASCIGYGSLVEAAIMVAHFSGRLGLARSRIPC